MSSIITIVSKEYVDGLVAGATGVSQVYTNATVQSSTSGLASVLFVNSMLTNRATQTYVNSTVQSSTSGLASVSFINSLLATKATINGDAPAGTFRLGTTNSQSFALRTNNTDRLTIDATGNIVQAGSTTTFDAVILRIRNTTAAFFEALAVTVAGVLNIGGGATEIQFMKPITNWKGTNSRFVETDGDGNTQAIEEIESYWIFNITVQNFLSDSGNWSSKVYTGPSLNSYSLEMGMVYIDSDYKYEMINTSIPIRLSRV